jgi:hypothetical protein
MLNIIPVVQVNNKIVPFEPFLVTNPLFSYFDLFLVANLLPPFNHFGSHNLGACWFDTEVSILCVKSITFSFSGARIIFYSWDEFQALQIMSLSLLS